MAQHRIATDSELCQTTKMALLSTCGSARLPKHVEALRADRLAALGTRELAFRAAGLLDAPLQEGRLLGLLALTLPSCQGPIV